MSPLFARLATLAFLGILSGISLNAALLQGGRVAYFDGREKTRDVVLQLDRKTDREVSHVASVPKSKPPKINSLDAKIRDVLSEAAPAEKETKRGRRLVASIQARLAELGYNPGARDGIAGPTTLAAIMAFEFDKGLPQTGIVDRELLAVLNARKERPQRDEKQMAVLKTGQELVAALQEALTKLGYNTGKADGVIGPMTRKRIRAFERDHKMDVTGRISGRLVQKINAARGKPLILARL